MTQTRRRFPKSFKREAVGQVLAGTPLLHVAETLGIAESLLSRWKRQCEQQGDNAFSGNGKQRGENAELRRLRDRPVMPSLGQVSERGRQVRQYGLEYADGVLRVGLAVYQQASLASGVERPP